MSKLSGIELLQTLDEICKHHEYECEKCEIIKLDGDTCLEKVLHNPEKVSELCEQWRKDHPRYMDMFFELFPNAMKMEDGSPKVCFHAIYGGYEDYSPEKNAELWRQPYKEERNV